MNANRAMLSLPSEGRIHLVGIGGAGLSAIARILLARGYAVSGSDLRASAATAALEGAGADVQVGHDAGHIQGAELVLATSAAADDHIEIAAARRSGITVARRREFIGALLRGRHVIAVAGTHGKTTTTSMIAHILLECGLAPGYIVGGTMGNTGVNAADGQGADFVIEADEYDNMFLGLRPKMAALTNVEHDHPDFFARREDMQESFARFVGSLPLEGALVACADDDGANALARRRLEARGPVILYGIENPDADWRASDLEFMSDATRFVVRRGSRRLGEARLRLPGRHNVLNALAALAVASERGLSFAESAEALSRFRATARRFEIRGQRAGVMVVDDYGHHPTEIRVNLDAARLAYPGRRIWAVWQPHTYSRVRQFWAEFVSAFADADRVLITPIYAARETAIDGIDSQRLANAMRPRTAANYVASFAEAAAILRHQAEAPALVIIFSAGDANRIAELYLDGA